MDFVNGSDWTTKMQKPGAGVTTARTADQEASEETSPATSYESVLKTLAEQKATFLTLTELQAELKKSQGQTQQEKERANAMEEKCEEALVSTLSMQTRAEQAESDLETFRRSAENEISAAKTRETTASGKLEAVEKELAQFRNELTGMKSKERLILERVRQLQRNATRKETAYGIALATKEREVGARQKPAEKELQQRATELADSKKETLDANARFEAAEAKQQAAERELQQRNKELAVSKKEISETNKRIVTI